MTNINLLINSGKCPIIIDTCILSYCLFKKNGIIHDNVILSFEKLLQFGKNYVAIVPGKKLYNEYTIKIKEYDNASIYELLSLYLDNENAISIGLMNKQEVHKFEKELEYFKNNKWIPLPNSEKYEDDPNIVYGLNKYNCKYIITIDKGLLEQLRKNFFIYFPGSIINIIDKKNLADKSFNFLEYMK